MLENFEFNLGFSGFVAGVKKLSFYILPGHVATRCELVFMFMGCLLMFWLGFRMWDALIEIPAVPEKLVLRSAYVTRLLNVSKAKKSLHFNVACDRGEYSYKIEFSHADTGELNVHKFKGLWVAVDSGSDDQFVWAVYDDEFRLVMSRQQIEWWAKYSNGSNYFMIVYACLASGYFVFFIIRCGICNRGRYKKVLNEDRES